MTTATYTVVGMTCGHCVSSVTEEVNGVTDLDVDLATGALTVTSDTAVDDAAIRAAVAEADYSIAEKPSPTRAQPDGHLGPRSGPPTTSGKKTR